MDAKNLNEFEYKINKFSVRTCLASNRVKLASRQVFKLKLYRSLVTKTNTIHTPTPTPQVRLAMLLNKNPVFQDLLPKYTNKQVQLSHPQDHCFILHLLRKMHLFLLFPFHH